MISDLIHGYACTPDIEKNHTPHEGPRSHRHEKPHLGLMVDISFCPEEKLHNLVMAFFTCNIQCCLAILYM